MSKLSVLHFLWFVVKSIYLTVSLEFTENFEPENLFSSVSPGYVMLQTSKCNYNYRFRNRERNYESGGGIEASRIYWRLLDFSSLCIILHVSIFYDHIPSGKFDIFGMNWLFYKRYHPEINIQTDIRWSIFYINERILFKENYHYMLFNW